MTQGTFGFEAPGKKKRRSSAAIRSAIDLFKLLLQDKYIMRRTSHDKKYAYCLYEGKNVPVRFMKTTAFDQLYKYGLLRKKKEAFFINRKATIQLHGNSKFKKAYKQFKRKK